MSFLTRTAIVRLLAPPVATAALIGVMGTTGWCPLCSAITSSLGGACGLAPADASAAPTALDDERAKSPETGPLHAAIFTDLDGKRVAVEEAVGKPMVIELWATWCGPCRVQRRLMHTLSAEFPDMIFVAASADEKGPQVVKDFKKKEEASETPKEGDAAAKSAEPSRVRDLMATPEFRALVRKRNAANSIPQTIYVNAKGEIIDVAVGAQSEKFMRAVLKNMQKAAAKQQQPIGPASPS
jgi:thiol-disulfide isomerase/thioredoxin